MIINSGIGFELVEKGKNKNNTCLSIDSTIEKPNLATLQRLKKEYKSVLKSTPTKIGLLTTLVGNPENRILD